MVNLTLTPDQIRSAPREVREWLFGLLAREMAFEPGAETAHHADGAAPSLAQCTPEDARRILEKIGADYLSAAVFFELGRELPSAIVSGQALHRVSVSDMLRHVRLPQPDVLLACLDRIDVAFRQVHSDGGSALFAFDQSGGIYISEATSRAIRTVWQALAQANGEPAADMPDMPEDEADRMTVVPDGQMTANAARNADGLGGPNVVLPQ